MRTALLILGVLLLAGCGPAEATKFKQTGTVKFNGTAVPEGAVMFEDPTTGTAERVELKPDGTYEVELNSGNYQVTVEPLMVETKPADGPADYQYKKVDNIPEKYRSGASSGLKHAVTGPGKFDIEMKK
jgi:hypothetical protein